MYPYYYRVLEVDPGATREEIRRAYRRLAKQYHPDINRNPGSKEQFLLIQQAWKTLGDPAARSRYDYYAKRYTHQQGEAPGQHPRQHHPDPNIRTRAYAGYGGRVYYRSGDQATLDKEDKIRTRDMLAGLAFILLFFVLPLTGKYWHSIILRLKGIDKTAEVVYIDDRITLSFEWGDDTRLEDASPKLLYIGDQVVIPRGMPLQPGDRFRIRVHPTKPEINRLYLDAPKPETLDRYCQMIYLRGVSSEMLDTLSAGSMKAVFLYTLCDSIYSNFGTGALANLYFADTPPEENHFNNRETYIRMTTHPVFRRILMNCRTLTSPI